ncbi:SET domain-containing protein 4 [Monomorium pharaonis]|uniref:SET domain-containing protein 4 n=1 Tax=Monomorium pharaonis TaxID=307658 RepID=UPI00063F832C|nr:SET domain-containing protein 4 [Monomorium pharaonis]
MGRTLRKRRQKKRLNFVKSNENTDESLIRLKSWLLSENCMSISYLIPEHFSLSGRGLKTIKRIESNEILIQLPLQMLITTDALMQSDIKTLFLYNTADSFSSQCMLAMFIIYEMHLGIKSKWYFYLQTLPQSFTNPDFCTNREKAMLPGFILHPLHQAHKLQEDFSLLMKAVKYLAVSRNRCPHCNVHLQEIITFAKYKWAYYIVNTRAVYIDAKFCKENIFNIKQPNNLALAPFLDLFNHNVNAAVKVSVVTDDCQNQFYQIVTLKPFDEKMQVFINYGAHNNLKLYIDYGFFIPCNPLDEIKFDILDVQRCFDISKNKLDFIMLNSFHENMSFTRDGLNYNATMTLFILSTNLERDRWKLKIYGEIFNTNERCIINKLGISILNLKKIEYACILSNMKHVKLKSLSFSIAIDLVEEYINILDAALSCMEKVGKGSLFN